MTTFEGRLMSPKGKNINLLNLQSLTAASILDYLT